MATAAGTRDVLCAIRWSMFASCSQIRHFLFRRPAAQTLAACCAAVMLMLCGAAPASALITDWQTLEGGAVRLVVAGKAADGSYDAGLEISLDPDWHTYWRYPGETGIPPELTLGGSANLASGTLSFPAPERYDDGFSQSVVYKEGVLLPLRLVPEDGSKPLTLDAKAFFGICNQICVPAEARFTLELPASPEQDRIAARLISAARAALPAPMLEAEGLRVTGFSFREGKKALKLDITADVGAAAAADLFAEGGKDASAGLPKPGERSGSTARWSLSLKGLTGPADALPLRLVLVADGKAVEAAYEIDSAARTIRRIDAPAR